MDERNFKNHAEKEFWEKVYLTALPTHAGLTAIRAADAAVATRRERMAGLIKPGVRAA